MPDLQETRAPDWSTLAGDIFCPLCGYNLRGLSENRCPECGHRFDWHALLNPPPTHPFLFDNNPSFANFFRTYFSDSRPRRFWWTVNPLHAIRPRCLAAYYLLTTALIGIGTLPRLVDVFPRNPTWAQLLDYAFFRRGQEGALFTILFWPPLTFLTLMIFRASMRRAKVRTRHVARAVIYSCDFAMPAMLFASLIPTSASYYMFNLYRYRSVPILLSIPLVTIAILRLGAAYDLYLAFHRPYWTALATQIIVALVVAVFAVN